MNEVPPVDPALSYAEASKYVQLSPRQFRRVFIDTGELPIVRVSAHRPRVRLSDLNACLKARTDRKSTRLNSSHLVISYAVFCLKKKTTKINERVVVTAEKLTPTNRT